jgi:imidazolonepropionase-like amidohydrolase
VLTRRRDTIDQLYLQELRGLLKGGLSPMLVIQSATLHSAEAMGLEEKLGSVEAGKWGDLVVLASNPLEDFETLVQPEIVIQGGEIVLRR